MARLPLEIDGVNFSELVDQKEYEVVYIHRDGGLGGLMRDGTKTRDILAWKAQITQGINYLTADQAAQLLQATMKEYVTVKFLDPAINATRTATFMPDLSGLKYAFQRGNIRYYKEGSVLTMEEQ